jgi:hypothetical protein
MGADPISRRALAGYARAMSRLRFGIAAVTALALAACAVPLTTAVWDPYPRTLVDKLRQADRPAVRAMLGEPADVRGSGEFWFYAQRRPVAQAIGAWDGTFPERWEWLGVMFDPQGEVLFAEASELERGCLSNGICNRSGGEALRQATAAAVITAPLHQDAHAKAYLVGANECAVYFYLEPDLPAPLVLWIDGRAHGPVDQATYLFFTRPPGKLQLAAGAAHLAADCHAGQSLFVSGHEPRPFAAAALATVPALKGEAAISVRRLALSD